MKNKKILILILLVIIMLGICLIMVTLNHNSKDGLKDDSESEVEMVEEKFSKIDPEEFKNKIIEELKNTKLNISDSENKNEVVTKFDDGEKFQGYVSAIITEQKDNKVTATVEIPCFKINCDSDGNFKNIEYTLEIMKGNTIGNAVKNVLKRDYGMENIDAVLGSEKFRKFIGTGTSGTVYYSSKELFVKTISEITGPIMINNHEYQFNENNCQDIIDLYDEYKTVTVGIDL